MHQQLARTEPGVSSIVDLYNSVKRHWAAGALPHEWGKRRGRDKSGPYSVNGASGVGAINLAPTV